MRRGPPRTRWLSSKVRVQFPIMGIHYNRSYLQGYEHREAVDGHEGVRLFESDGQFEYVSLPRLRLSGHPLTLPVSFSSIYRCQY
jgi:hypothetical protein